MATEITTDIGADQVPIPEEPSRPKEKLPPGKWIRKNLFNNWYNSILTIVLSVVILFLLWRVASFVFVTARWQPIGGQSAGAFGWALNKLFAGIYRSTLPLNRSHCRIASS